MPTPEALFLPDGDCFVPTELARGPWDPGALHGGPPAALATRALEAALGADTSLTRVTIELVRPVPLRPLRVRAERTRPGRRVRLAEATLEDPDGTEVLRARALGVRRAEPALPPPAPERHHAAVPPRPAPPDGVAPAPWSATAGADDVTAFHTDACEHRFTEGSWDEPGPVTVWIRLRSAVVAGEEPSGAQRAAAVADFGNGVSAVLPFEDWRYINPDLTLHLLREPAGPWIGLQAATHLGDAGAGMAESALWDARGRVGRAVQSLLVEPR